MKLIFARKHALGSYIIRLFTFSSWSHVAVVFSDNKVFDVTLAKGVRFSNLEDFLGEYTDVDIYSVDIPDEAAARAFAEEQVGKKYDLSAIFGLIFQREWQEDDRWFCSEVTESVLASGGKKRFKDKLYRITPQQSWSVY